MHFRKPSCPTPRYPPCLEIYRYVHVYEARDTSQASCLYIDVPNSQIFFWGGGVAQRMSLLSIFLIFSQQKILFYLFSRNSLWLKENICSKLHKKSTLLPLKDIRNKAGANASIRRKYGYKSIVLQVSTLAYTKDCTLKLLIGRPHPLKLPTKRAGN